MTESQTPVQVQTPVALLSQAAEVIAASAPPLNIAPEQWLEMRRASVRARCVECGMMVSGDDLLRLAARENFTSKLDRLAHQYCARKSCESRYYILTFEPLEGIDWAPLVGSLPTADYSKGGERRTRGLAVPRAALLRAAALLVIGIVSLTLFRSWYYGLRIPLLQPKHHYTTNPTPEER